VCPIGDDRKLFQATKNTKKYLQEKEILTKESDHPDYRSWEHFRRYGNWSEKEVGKR
jgi:hypothetical protein